MKMESWEVRWFGRGAIPLTLQQWAEENSLTTQPVRTDYYLIHNAIGTMGIKWREGNIQIKELLEKTSDLNPREHYIKWSFNLKEGDQLENIRAQNEWIAVTKKRDLIKWQVIKGKLTEIETASEAPNGVELEISGILCREELWWTLALEATGNKEDLESVLDQINIPVNNESECLGYAEWLERNFSK